jgi:hypothetical protein
VGGGFRKYVVAEGWVKDQFVPGEPKRIAEGVYAFMILVAAVSWIVGGVHTKDAVGLMVFMAISTLVCAFTGFCLPYQVHQCYFPPPEMELEVDIDYSKLVVWGAGGGKRGAERAAEKKAAEKAKAQQKKSAVPKKSSSGPKPKPKTVSKKTPVALSGANWKIVNKVNPKTGQSRQVRVITKKVMTRRPGGLPRPLPKDVVEKIEIRTDPVTGKKKKVIIRTVKVQHDFKIVEKERVDPKTGKKRMMKVKVITRKPMAGQKFKIVEKERVDPATGVKRMVKVKVIYKLVPKNQKMAISTTTEAQPPPQEKPEPTPEAQPQGGEVEMTDMAVTYAV